IANTLTLLLARTARDSAFSGRRNISPTRRLDRHSGDKGGGADGNTGSASTGAIASSCALALRGAPANRPAIAHGSKRIVIEPAKPAAPLMPKNLSYHCLPVKQPVHKSDRRGCAFDAIDRGGRSAPERAAWQTQTCKP